MRLGWQSGVVLAGLLGVAWAAADAAPTNSLFASETETANATMKSISSAVAEIEGLLTQATQENKQIKASCISEKLRRARADKQAGGIVLEGWALGANDAEYAQRQLDRILLLQVYSLVFVEEARACVEASLSGKGGGGDDKGSVSDDYPEGPLRPVRPPRCDRPPFASPY